MLFFCPRCIGRVGASKKRRLILLLSVGWLPPYVRPSGACLCLGSSILYKPPNAIEGYTKPGLRLCRCTLANLSELNGSWCCVPSRVVWVLWGYGHLLGNGPQESDELTGNGDGDHIAVLASCNKSPVTVTEPHLGFPTDVLDDFGLSFQSQLQVAAHLSRIAIGPGAFDQDASGMSITGCGHGALPALLTGGVF